MPCMWLDETLGKEMLAKPQRRRRDEEAGSKKYACWTSLGEEASSIWDRAEEDRRAQEGEPELGRRSGAAHATR